MIDLRQASPALFACALESNLRRLGPVRKVESHFLDSLRIRLHAGCAWLVPASHDSGSPPHQLRGDGSLFNEKLISAFLLRERPSIPETVLLSRVALHSRHTAIIGAARPSAAFSAPERRTFDRLCDVFAAELERREEERLGRVLDRIREKIVAELRPRDLAYQILDGLHELVDYDHSSAFLAYDRNAGVFRIEAEKIVWTKAKSARVGHELRIPADGGAGFTRLQATSVFAADDGDPLHRALDYHRDPGAPPVTSLLAAPLFFDREFLGLLKIASAKRSAFDSHDIAVVQRFLPAAAVSMRNAQVNRSLESQAMQAEIKAGLVTLASAVAHDVNNAVGSILPLAQQMQEDLRQETLDRAAFGRDLEVIVDNARLCQRIFSNMLRAAGPGRFTEEPVDLNQVVADTLPFFQGQASRRRVEVELDLGTSLPTFRASRHDLQHILLNLVNNSLDALVGKSGRIVVTTRASSDSAVLTVCDDGPGIRPDLLGKVQEPFFSTKPGSTGLGLSICRALAWQNGGALEIHSSGVEESGTRVSVTFAMQAAPVATHEVR
jgi:signal transduction histidine kinase